jgi:hypothetical protein
MNNATVDDAIFSTIGQLMQDAFNGWAPAIAVLALFGIVLLVMLVLGTVDAFAKRDVASSEADVYTDTKVRE